MIINNRQPVIAISQICAVCDQPISSVGIMLVEDFSKPAPVLHPFCAEFPIFDVTNRVGMPFDSLEQWLIGAGFTREASTEREDDGGVYVDRSRELVVRVNAEEYFVYPLAKLEDQVIDFYDAAREREVDRVDVSLGA